MLDEWRENNGGDLITIQRGLDAFGAHNDYVGWSYYHRTQQAMLNYQLMIVE
jgi:hypothetical protein